MATDDEQTIVQALARTFTDKRVATASRGHRFDLSRLEIKWRHDTLARLAND